MNVNLYDYGYLVSLSFAPFPAPNWISNVPVRCEEKRRNWGEIKSHSTIINSTASPYIWATNLLLQLKLLKTQQRLRILMAFSQTLFAACVTRLSLADTPSTVSLAKRFVNSVSLMNRSAVASDRPAWQSPGIIPKFVIRLKNVKKIVSGDSETFTIHRTQEWATEKEKIFKYLKNPCATHKKIFESSYRNNKNTWNFVISGEGKKTKMRIKKTSKITLNYLCP